MDIVCPRGINQINLTTDNWYQKYAKTECGDIHCGKLELVTWDFVGEDGEEYSWGGQLKVNIIINLYYCYYYYYYYHYYY